MKKGVTLKEVFESDDWIITKVKQGLGMHRINAKRRSYRADGQNLFCEWGNNRYLEKLAKENYGKKLHEFRTYEY